MLISKFEIENIEEKITQLEVDYEINLPEQYRNFLLQYNGGLTPKTYFKIRKVDSDIRAFYGFGRVEFSFEDIELKEWISQRLFPIACDTFGNEIVIGLCDDIIGKILFFDHELGKTHIVADDLQSFVKVCKSEKINPAVHKPIEQREAELIARGRGHIITDGLRKAWQDEIDRFANVVQEQVIIK